MPLTNRGTGVRTGRTDRPCSFRVSYPSLPIPPFSSLPHPSSCPTCSLCRGANRHRAACPRTLKRISSSAMVQAATASSTKALAIIGVPRAPHFIFPFVLHTNPGRSSRSYHVVRATLTYKSALGCTLVLVRSAVDLSQPLELKATQRGWSSHRTAMRPRSATSSAPTLRV